MSRFKMLLETLSYEEKEVLCHELRLALRENRNERISMERVAEKVCQVVGVQRINFKMRTRNQVTAKVILCRALRRVGYSAEEIASFTGLSEKTLPYYEIVFRDWICNSCYQEEVNMWNQLKNEIRLCD